MIKKLFTTLFFALSAVATMAQDAYIFTSFREPSTGGLHYLYSYDGLKWDTSPGLFPCWSTIGYLHLPSVRLYSCCRARFFSFSSYPRQTFGLVPFSFDDCATRFGCGAEHSRIV